MPVKNKTTVQSGPNDVTQLGDQTVSFKRYEMCILFIKLLKAAKPGEFKLILASNRDELFKRPGKTAHFWEEDANIFGGRDMTENKEGGTWLAMSKKGKLGVLLNVTGEETNPNALGRGFLVADYLKSSLTEKEYLDKVMANGNQYCKFHLVTAFLGPRPSLHHYTNSSKSPGLNEVQSEVFALGNSPLNKPFLKVTRGKEKFEKICNNFGETKRKEQLLEELLSLLKWEKKHYPDEVIDSLCELPLRIKPNYSAVFVNAPELHYGTRTHTIILVDWNNNVDYLEWTLKEPIDPMNFEWSKTCEEFTLNPGVL